MDFTIQTDADVVAQYTEGIVRKVMDEGARKYGAIGFETKTDVIDCLVHMMGHLTSWICEEPGDNEDHLSHALTRLAMAHYLHNTQEVKE